ncbi:hypothetical protein [uncultured Shewanella sp.]|uniref:hypothetical protein n=1 Tax=uncultured Shewanella sp. TaxID=173975 RepID=UPI002609317A|nr:hypothetical protein [uncultured Shewanella sp.]
MIVSKRLIIITTLALTACSSNEPLVNVVNKHYIDPTPLDIAVIRSPIQSTNVIPVGPNKGIIGPPTKYEHYSHVILPQEIAFLMPKGNINPRLKIHPQTGQIQFLVKKGPLKNNVDNLFSFTSATVHYIDVTDRHRLPNSFWIKSETILGILDELLKPYQKPQQLFGQIWLNDIITISHKRY